MVTNMSSKSLKSDPNITNYPFKREEAGRGKTNQRKCEQIDNWMRILTIFAIPPVGLQISSFIRHLSTPLGNINSTGSSPHLSAIFRVNWVTCKFACLPPQQVWHSLFVSSHSHHLKIAFQKISIIWTPCMYEITTWSFWIPNIFHLGFQRHLFSSESIFKEQPLQILLLPCCSLKNTDFLPQLFSWGSAVPSWCLLVLPVF